MLLPYFWAEPMILDGFAGACMIAVQYGRCTADVMRRDRPLVSGKRKTSRTLKDEYNKEAEKASIEILRFGLAWGRRGPVCLRAASCPGLTFRRTMTHHNEPAVQRFQGGTAIDSSVQDRSSSKGRWQRCHFKPRRHWFTSIVTKLQLAFCSQLSPMDFGLLWQAVAKCRPISFLQAVNAVWSGSAGGSGGGQVVRHSDLTQQSSTFAWLHKMGNAETRLTPSTTTCFEFSWLPVAQTSNLTSANQYSRMLMNPHPSSRRSCLQLAWSLPKNAKKLMQE